MALSPRLEIRQTQQLSMTPQLRQAIALLQMSNLELTEHLTEEVEKNPLLELMMPETYTPRFDGRSSNIVSSDNFDSVGNVVSEKTLRDELRTQIQMQERDSRRSAIACILVDELDDRGYLSAPIFEIVDRLRISQAELEDALAVLQSCDPVGVGARDLKECLLLQLKELGRSNPASIALINNLEMIASGKLDELSKRIGVSGADLTDMISEIQDLNPRPVAGYNFDITQTAIPDVYVLPSAEGGWRVELNTATLPKVLVNEQYAAEIAKNGGEAKEFVQEHLSNARFLVKAMDQRAKTILRVATVLVRHQNLYFESGVSGLRPLTLAAVADELKVHESTVSRVTAGKYLYCPRGNFELRFFFVQRIARLDGEPDMATPIVRERIRNLIAQESNKKPLSDEIITNILRSEGVDIARRTIAKYREVMGIPSSSRRRRQKI